MDKTKIVAEGKFEGSKMYFRKVNLKEIKKIEKENYFLKLCKKIKKSR
jgi:hypothetical protein